jgi:ADP-heptose:LPS heptosyltransferase
LNLPILKYDCIHFLGDRPCKPNKQYGVLCAECTLYERDESITDEFPLIGPREFEEDPETEKKIVIVKLDAVGDVLRTTSILPSLKEKYIDSYILWLTKERSFDVLKDNDLIDEIYFDSDELEPIYNDKFDIAINLDSGTESCAIMDRIVAKERFGYTIANGKPYPLNTLANEWYLMGVDDVSKKKNLKTYHQIIHEICNLPYSGSRPALGFPPEKHERTEELKAQYGLAAYSELVLVNLGGGNRWQYKKWTKEGYIQLIDRLSANSSCGVGIIAGNEDMDFYREISEKVQQRENVIKFRCDNPTEDFICIVQLFDKVFTSDSLCMHIATALGKFTLAVAGPTSYTELDVFGSGKVVYSDKVDCLCCYLNTCPKTVNCMNTLSAEKMYAILAGKY